MIQRSADGQAARIVFDTNVLLSLWVFADSRFAPLRERIDRGDWIALTDEHCLAEFKRVLGYDQFKLDVERQAQIHAITAPLPRPATRARHFSSPCRAVLIVTTRNFLNSRAMRELGGLSRRTRRC